MQRAALDSLGPVEREAALADARAHHLSVGARRARLRDEHRAGQLQPLLGAIVAEHAAAQATVVLHARPLVAHVTHVSALTTHLSLISEAHWVS